MQCLAVFLQVCAYLVCWVMWVGTPRFVFKSNSVSGTLLEAKRELSSSWRVRWPSPEIGSFFGSPHTPPTNA